MRESRKFSKGGGPRDTEVYLGEGGPRNTRNYGNFTVLILEIWIFWGGGGPVPRPLSSAHAWKHFFIESSNFFFIRWISPKMGLVVQIVYNTITCLY